MAPVLPKTITFVFFGPSECILQRSAFLGIAECTASCILSESQFVRHRRKDTGDVFLLLRVRRTTDITTIWRSGLVPWMLAVNKRLQKYSCRLAVQDQVAWMAFRPGDKRNTAKVTRDTSTSPLATSNRFAALTDTSDAGPGPQSVAPLIPEQVLVPATAPSLPTSTTSAPGVDQIVHRGTVHVGTWNVRGLKVQKHVHKPVDVSLTLASKDINICAVQETWLDPSVDTVITPGFDFVGTAGYATEVGPRGGTGFLIKQDVMGCVTQLRWKGQKFDQATWVRMKSKSRQNSIVLVSAYVRPVSPTRSHADFAEDLNALTVDIEYWQRNNTVVVCGDFNARIGRQGADAPTNSVIPQFGETTRDAQGATLVDLMNTTGMFSLANRTGPDTKFTCIRTQGQSVVDYFMGPASFLKFTTSVAHYIVDDDSDHVLMRLTIPGHLVKRKSKTKTTVSWRLDLLKDAKIADTYRAQIADRSHAVIDAMDEYQNIDQHQVDKVFEQVADIIRQAASVSIGCKISKGRGTAAWWTKEYAATRSETQEAYEVAMHSKLASDWETFATLRKQKNKEMKRLKRALFSRDADTTASLWRKEHGSKAAWRAAKQLRDTRAGSMPANRAPACESIRAADGQEVTEPEGITAVFREHYKQLGSPLVCDEFDEDNFERVTSKVQEWVSSQSTKRDARYDEPFSKEEMEHAVADLPTYKAGDAADLKSELIKAGGSALVKLLLKLVNWVWELEILPTAWSQGVIVNLFKAGDTQLPGNYRGITLVSICRKMFTNMVRKRLESQVHLHEAQAAFRSKRSCTDNLFVLSRILQEAGKANKTVYAFFLDVRKAYDTVWRDGLSYKLLEKGVDGKLWRVLRDLAVKSTSQVRVNGDLSEAFPLSVGVGQGDPLSTLLFDIFIDDLVAGLHDTCSEHGICMGQTDVASLLYADDANALSFTPSGLQSLMDYIHTWLNKWRMQGNFQKSKVMVFHPKEGESCNVPAQDRLNTWTLGGIAIDQVSTYKYLGVVYQEDGSWVAHAQKALAKMQAAYGYWRPLLACSSLPTKVRLLMVQTFIYSAVMYGAEVWDTTKAVKDKMSAVVKKALRSILALHPRDCSSDVLYGDTGLLPPGVLIDAAKLCWQHRCQNMEAGRWPKVALRFSFEGSRGVGRPKVGTDWCGTVKSITEQIQHTLNIAKVTSQAKGQPAMRRVAPRRSPASLDAVRGQPEMDTQDDDADEQKVEGGSVREAVLTNLWLTALTQLRPTYTRCPEGKPCWLPDCLLDQGRNVAEYLAVLPSRDARVIASARSGKLCVMDLRLDQKIDGASGCLHSCMHCGEAQGDTMEACVHRMLHCSAVQSSVDQFRSQDFAMKLNWEAPLGSDLVYSILSPEWNADMTRADKVRYWAAVANLFRGVDLCRSETMEEVGSGHEDSSHDILTLDALQDLSRSQVTPGVVNVHADTADM
jgi:exonuclease III